MTRHARRQPPTRRPRRKSRRCVFCRRGGSVRYYGDQRRAVTLLRVTDPAHSIYPERSFYCCLNVEGCAGRAAAIALQEEGHDAA